MWQWTKSAWARQIFSISRFLHVYVSTLLFGLLIFFCITGIFLNHLWYNSDSNTSVSNTEEISQQQVKKWRLSGSQSTDVDGEWQPEIGPIVSDVSQRYSLPMPTSIDIDPDMNSINLDYQVPAGYATVFIDAENRNIELFIQEGSFVGVLNDLHKGRHSGVVWKWLIDISAVLMILFGLTGLIILMQGKKYRVNGLIGFFIGVATPLIIAIVFVPSL